MSQPEVEAGVADADLSGRTALVTGSTDGIGREVALALGRLGATVVVHGRDAAKGERVVEALESTPGDGDLRTADFASPAAVRELAAAVTDDHGHLDVVVHNAGGFWAEGRLTDAGVEYTFAVNHLAPFVLTAELLPALRAAPDPRVVVVASEAHRAGEMDFESLRSVEDYDGWTAYTRSKLANVLFARELDRRAGDLVVNACHPGTVVESGFTRNMAAPFRVGLGLVSALPDALTARFLDTAATAAETPVYLAAAPDLGVSGAYFEDCEPVEPSAAARDDEVAARLWTVSADLTGVEPVPAPE